MRQLLDEPRPSGCPSGFSIDRWRLGELERTAANDLSDHVSSCLFCRRMLSREAEAFSAIRDRAELVERIAARAPPRWTWRRTVPLAATAAALGLFVALGPSPQQERFKGAGFDLEVFRDRSGQIEKIQSGARCLPGDRLRFRIAMPEPRHVLIVGTEAGGERFLYYPIDGSDRAIEHAAGRSEIPGSAKLDRSLGAEAILFVACDRPISLAQLSEDATEGCVTRSFEIHKEPR